MNKQSQFTRRCRGPLYKQTQSGAAQVVSAGQFCGTKPIRAIMPIWRSAFPGGRIMPNKAKLGRHGVSGGVGVALAGADYAKQTQFGWPDAATEGGMRGTKPKSGSRHSVAGRRLYKQSQLRRSEVRSVQFEVQNKANLGKPGRQSRQGPSCQTNPIWARGSRAGYTLFLPPIRENACQGPAPSYRLKRS
jgi:hypothetical protein